MKNMDLTEKQKETVKNFVDMYSVAYGAFDKRLSDLIKNGSLKEISDFNREYLDEAFYINNENLIEAREGILDIIKDTAVKMYISEDIDIDKELAQDLGLKPEDFTIETPFFEKEETIDKDEYVQNLIKDMESLSQNKDIINLAKEYREMVDTLAQMQERTKEAIEKLNHVQKQIDELKKAEKSPEEKEKLSLFKRFINAIKRYFESFSKEVDEIAQSHVKEAKDIFEKGKNLAENLKPSFYAKKIKDSVLVRVLPNLIKNERHLAEQCRETAKTIDDFHIKNQILGYEVKNALRKYAGMSELEFEKKERLFVKLFNDRAERLSTKADKQQKTVTEIKEPSKELESFKYTSSLGCVAYDLTGYREGIDEGFKDNLYRVKEDTKAPISVTFDRDRNALAIHFNKDWEWDRDAEANAMKRNALISELSEKIFQGKALQSDKGVYYQAEASLSPEDVMNIVSASVGYSLKEMYKEASMDNSPKRDLLIKDAIANDALKYFAKEDLANMIKENPLYIEHVSPNPLTKRQVETLQRMAITNSETRNIPNVMKAIEKSGHTTDKIREMACRRNYLSIIEIPNPSDSVREVASKKGFWKDNPKTKDKSKSHDKDKNRSKDRDNGREDR